MARMVYARAPRPAGAPGLVLDPPATQTPADLATVRGDVVTFAWSRTIGGVHAVERFRLRICGDAGMTADCVVHPTTGTSLDVPLAPGVYYWRLDQGIAAGLVTPDEDSWVAGAVRTLTVRAPVVTLPFPFPSPRPQVPPPTAPRQLSPAVGEVMRSRSVTLRWTAVAGAGGYEVTVCNADNMCRTSTYGDVPGVATPGVTQYAMPITMERDGDYTWSVRAVQRETGTAGTPSQVQAFRVQSDVAPVVNPTPIVTPMPIATEGGFRMPALGWIALGGLGAALLLWPRGKKAKGT